MANDDVSISRLSSYAKTILDKLNSKRLFNTEGSLPRDLRGLAGLIGLSSQEAQTFSTVTAVLDEWVRRDPRNAVVHQLFRRLETIDRYDIRDDLMALAVDDRLVIPNAEAVPELQMARQNSILTVDDMIEGPVLYDAVILYADAPQDEAFVDALSEVLTDIGFRLFHKHSLRPGVMEMTAMAELISTRCRYTILVFSPAFFANLESARADQFYSQYVQAHQVAENTHQMIPCVLEECSIPSQFKHYSKIELRNNKNFWRTLIATLNYRTDREQMLDIPSWVHKLGALNIQAIQSANVPLHSGGNKLMGAAGAIGTANPSGPTSQHIHGHFSGHSNRNVANHRSNQPSNTNFVPGPSVSNTCGSVNNSPTNSTIFNGQVANVGNMLIGAAGANRTANPSGPTSQHIHGHFSGHSNRNVANHRSNQPSNTNFVPGPSVSNTCGSVNNSPTNSTIFNGQVANVGNMLIGAAGAIRTANPSGSSSQHIHDHFSGHSNRNVANHRSNQPSNTNVVPGPSVSNTCGSVNNSPTNSTIFNGQVANVSFANSPVAGGSTSSNGFVNGHFGNGAVNNNTNGYFRSQSTDYPNVRFANAASATSSQCNWSFNSDEVSNESVIVSGQVVSAAAANSQRTNAVINSKINSFAAQSQVSNDPVADSPIGNGFPNCPSSSGFISNNEATTSTSNAQTVNASVTRSAVTNRSIPNGQIICGSINDQFSNDIEITDGRPDEPSDEYVVNIRVISEPIVAPYAADLSSGQSSQSNTSSNGLLANEHVTLPSNENQRSISEYFSKLWRTRSWAIRKRISQNRPRC